MKNTLLIIAFVISSFGSVLAQDPNAIAAAQSACGPADVKFDAKVNTTQHPTPVPDADKALVYVVQDLGEYQCQTCALTRLGMDGTWVGANPGSAYFFFSVEPGDHHLCLNWQSVLETRNRAFAMADFTAEAGHVYYFRSRIFASRTIYYFDLDLINSDEGKFLVASAALSVWQPKKKK